MLQTSQIAESPIDNHGQSHIFHSHLQGHDLNGEPVNLPTPEMSPLENSDREGLNSTSSSENDRSCPSKGSPVLQLISKFGGKSYPRTSAPFAQFHIGPIQVEGGGNSNSRPTSLSHQQQEQYFQQQSEHPTYVSRQYHNTGTEFPTMIPPPSPYAPYDHSQFSGNNSEQPSGPSWLIQEDDRYAYEGFHGYGDGFQQNLPYNPHHYDHFLPQSPIYPPLDANHNSYYSYGVKMDSPELLSYDNNSPTNTNSNSSSGGNVNEFDGTNNNSSSSLIFKALSEACDANI